ncbi:HET-C domain protein HetC [Paecilomyces variotii No. 5]|uniref:HET-C domain protein HetC n=1 Tax=Byssochlamys spectabilis (strain No. 5 / NBRC 109023) TaxID=1356009 RepID=V5FQ57_BYSSN|nr:HET-C domain protein HetC [Paecilomyces variotii No. 5]
METVGHGTATSYALGVVGCGVKPMLLVLAVLLVLLPAQVHAFGAGNIASISAVEGKNWRHGDIEDMLKTIAFIKGHKWTSMMVKRVYFGNWLRDYSQAMDVGTLKNLQADTIRILVWILAFLGFGYATEEFEVTSERLGVYRPEEHIDNPKDYADNLDARQYDSRLRPPVRQVELDIDPQTGMKNYIANEHGDWATSSAYVKFSMSRSIHYGRMYLSGGHHKGKEADLCEALRCLGQGLHTLEDFGAHTNYCELALREMGFHNVFPHTGAATQINLHGHHVFPLVTGTFGMVDFFHSVLGEATDHFTQSEVNEMDIALGDAEANASSGPLNNLTGLLGKVPGTRGLVTEAEHLKEVSDAQEHANNSRGIHMGYSDGSSRGFEAQSRGYDQGSGWAVDDQYDQSRASETGGKPTGLPGLPDFDPQKTIKQIYPILQFRDKVVRTVSSIIEKIPGLEALVEKISETVTVFVMSLLAPFIRPLINAASKSLQTGSAGVIDASGKHQYEPWTDPHCTDPTHSLLSKDHFSNILNEPAGHVASEILKYVASRVLSAWQNIDIPVERVMDDIMHVFHHPAVRNMNNEVHRNMFEAVQQWVHSRPDRGASLNDILSAEGVRAGKNQTGGDAHSHGPGHSHGGGNFPALGGAGSGYGHGSYPHYQQQQHQASGGPSLPWDKLNKLPIPGLSELSKIEGKLSSFLGGGSSREAESAPYSGEHQPTPPPGGQYGGYQPPPPPQQYGGGPGPNYPPQGGYEPYHQSPDAYGPGPNPPPEHNAPQGYHQGPGYGHDPSHGHGHSHHGHHGHHGHGHGHSHEGPGYGYGGGPPGGYGY